MSTVELFKVVAIDVGAIIIFFVGIFIYLGRAYRIIAPLYAIGFTIFIMCIDWQYIPMFIGVGGT